MAETNFKIKKTMRLFGLPYQFRPEVDPRVDTVSDTIGKKFCENVLLDAPVISIIPGKPKYLPGVKDKYITSQAIINGASGDLDPLKNIINNNKKTTKAANLRYYDFQRDYTDYMRYVNILCRTLAAFLEIDGTIDNTSYQRYDWSNYRWNDSEYANTSASAKLIKKTKNNIIKKFKSAVSSSNKKDSNSNNDNSGTNKKKSNTNAKKNTNKNNGSSNKKTNKKSGGNSGTFSMDNIDAYVAANPNAKVNSEQKSGSNQYAAAQQKENTKKKKTSAKKTIQLDQRIEDKNPKSNKMLYETTTGGDDDEIDSMTWQEVLSNNSYVQFYVDPDVGYNESMSNSTGESKLKGMFDSGSEMFKEIAFIANSGGTEDFAEGMTDFLSGSTAYLAEKFSSGGSFTSILTRLLGVSSNIVKGDNIVIPDVYQSSKFEKSYSFTVHLKAPYGSKKCWFFEIGVPLMHLLALALPKQTSANTYGSPFMVKAYVDGVFSCNIGIVSSIEINKNVSPDSWTVDGLPSEVDVRLSIDDLYSDLSMSSQENPIQFINNASLVEYLAVTCGMNLIAPKLAAKAQLAVQTIANTFKDIPTNVRSSISESADNLLISFLGLDW